MKDDGGERTTSICFHKDGSWEFPFREIYRLKAAICYCAYCAILQLWLIKKKTFKNDKLIDSQKLHRSSVLRSNWPKNRGLNILYYKPNKFQKGNAGKQLPAH